MRPQAQTGRRACIAMQAAGRVAVAPSSVARAGRHRCQLRRAQPGIADEDDARKTPVPSINEEAQSHSLCLHASSQQAGMMAKMGNFPGVKGRLHLWHGPPKANEFLKELLKLYEFRVEIYYTIPAGHPFPLRNHL